MTILPSIRNRMIESPFWLRKYMGFRRWKWKNGDRSPWCAAIKPTWKCNLSCDHCFWKGKFHSPDLSTREWYRIINQLARKGCVEIAIEGGEPTLRNDFYELVTYARKKMRWVYVVSNGQKPIKRIDVDRLLISVDGLESSHDRLRGNGTFKKLDNVITQYNCRENLYLLISVWQGNQSEIRDIMDYFLKRVCGFWFSFMYQTPDMPQITLDRDQRIEIANQILAFKSSYPIYNGDLYLKTIGCGIKCHDWLLTTVLADGRIAERCYPLLFDGIGCDDCDLACYRDLDALHFPDNYRKIDGLFTNQRSKSK